MFQIFAISFLWNNFDTVILKISIFVHENLKAFRSHKASYSQSMMDFKRIKIRNLLCEFIVDFFLSVIKTKSFILKY